MFVFTTATLGGAGSRTHPRPIDCLRMRGHPGCHVSQWVRRVGASELSRSGNCPAGDSRDHHQKGTRNMAQQTTVTLTDDLDGRKAAETVTFGLDGRIYEIDLNKKNATALRKVLGEFTGSARRVRSGRPAANARASRSRIGSMPRRSGNGRRHRALRSPPAAGYRRRSSSNTRLPRTEFPRDFSTCWPSTSDGGLLRFGVTGIAFRNRFSTVKDSSSPFTATVRSR